MVQDFAKYLLLSGNSNEDRIGRQRQELDFFLLSSAHQTSVPVILNLFIPSVTHKLLCSHKGAQVYLKQTDSFLYCEVQGAVGSEKKVMSQKHQQSNIYA